MHWHKISFNSQFHVDWVGTLDEIVQSLCQASIEKPFVPLVLCFHFVGTFGQIWFCTNPRIQEAFVDRILWRFYFAAWKNISNVVTIQQSPILYFSILCSGLINLCVLGCVIHSVFLIGVFCRVSRWGIFEVCQLVLHHHHHPAVSVLRSNVVEFSHAKL